MRTVLAAFAAVSLSGCSVLEADPPARVEQPVTALVRDVCRSHEGVAVVTDWANGGGRHVVCRDGFYGEVSVSE